MNILGHNYISYKVLGRINSFIAAGSEIPDFVPFIPKSIFKFSEIHEGGEILAKSKNNNVRDIGLSMCCHSVKYGADFFNTEIDKWLFNGEENKKREIAKKIVDCSGVSFDVAINLRLHNYLWSGIDIYLMEKEKDFISKLTDSYKNLDLNEISNILSKEFKKPLKDVKRDVNYFFEPIIKSDLTNLDGYISYTKKAISGLPEKDILNPKKAKLLTQRIYTDYYYKWEGILEFVIKEVNKNLKNIL